MNHQISIEDFKNCPALTILASDTKANKSLTMRVDPVKKTIEYQVTTNGKIFPTKIFITAIELYNLH